MRQLHATRETFLAALAPYGPRILSLYPAADGLCSEPAEFLSLLTNGEARRVLAPSGDIGQTLADRRLTFGFDAHGVRRGRRERASFGAMISLKDYPLRSLPGMLDGVLRLPFEMVLTESFAFVEQQAALTAWAWRCAGCAPPTRRDQPARRARRPPRTMSRPAARPTASIICRSWSAGRPGGAGSAPAADVQSALAETGAIAVREDINLEPAFWAQFPGNFGLHRAQGDDLDRQFRQLGQPSTTIPTGQAEGNHWGAAVTVLETTSFGPYYFNFHTGDLGNFTVIGPSGSGKTVLLAFLLAQAERMQPRIVLFRQGPRRRDLHPRHRRRLRRDSPGEPTGFNPLALPDTGEPTAPSWREWLSRLLCADGAPLTAEDRALIADAVDANFAEASRPPPPALSARAVRGASAAPAPAIWPRGSGLVRAAASTPGCSTMPTTRWTSSRASSAST